MGDRQRDQQKGLSMIGKHNREECARTIKIELGDEDGLRLCPPILNSDLKKTKLGNFPKISH